ncbi:MAG: ECF transporter S component [Clostridiaceae bacterium]|nr:ECF transporter S component [Clostridiaceae bacterium]
MNTQTVKKSKIRKLSITSVMAAASAILMFIETPLPFFPSFLQIDASDLPAVLCSFAIGPAWGIAVQLIKNLIHMLATKTMVAGEVANFLIGAAFVLPAGVVYNKIHTKKGAILGLTLGTVFMTVIGILTNYFITLPLYSRLMPIDAIIELSSKANPYIKDVFTLILYGITPFNFFKGVAISLLSLLIYKPLSPILRYTKQ